MEAGRPRARRSSAGGSANSRYESDDNVDCILRACAAVHNDTADSSTSVTAAMADACCRMLVDARGPLSENVSNRQARTQSLAKYVVDDILLSLARRLEIHQAAPGLRPTPYRGGGGSRPLERALRDVTQDNGARTVRHDGVSQEDLCAFLSRCVPERQPGPNRSLGTHCLPLCTWVQGVHLAGPVVVGGESRLQRGKEGCGRGAGVIQDESGTTRALFFVGDQTSTSGQSERCVVIASVSRSVGTKTWAVASAFNMDDNHEIHLIPVVDAVRSVLGDDADARCGVEWIAFDDGQGRQLKGATAFLQSAVEPAHDSPVGMLVDHTSPRDSLPTDLFADGEARSWVVVGVRGDHLVVSPIVSDTRFHGSIQGVPDCRVQVKLPVHQDTRSPMQGQAWSLRRSFASAEQIGVSAAPCDMDVDAMPAEESAAADGFSIRGDVDVQRAALVSAAKLFCATSPR